MDIKSETEIKEEELDLGNHFHEEDSQISPDNETSFASSSKIKIEESNKIYIKSEANEIEEESMLFVEQLNNDVIKPEIIGKESSLQDGKISSPNNETSFASPSNTKIDELNTIYIKSEPSEIEEESILGIEQLNNDVIKPEIIGEKSSPQHRKVKVLNISDSEKVFEDCVIEFPDESEDEFEVHNSDDEETFVLNADDETIVVDPDYTEITETVTSEDGIINDNEPEDNTPYVPKWKKKKENVPSFNFVEEMGPTEYVKCDKSDATECFLFNKLLGDELYEHIVFQTNLYATQKQKKFAPTSIEEIKKFLAVNFLMGIKPLPSLSDYWSSDPQLRDHYISNVMSFERFRFLLSSFHMNDNSKIPSRNDINFDKLYKIRPFINMLNDQFRKCYKPSEFQSIDQLMIKFKGRCGFKQFMSRKPIKRGYKVWVRADSHGYICQFEIYTGKGVEKGLGLGESVVKRLSEQIKGKNYKIFADEFFSSVPLAYNLQKQNIGYCGTIRSTRKYVPDMKADKLMKKGNIDYRMESNGISITKCKNYKSILFISNMHNPSMTEIMSRKSKDGKRSQIKGTVINKQYNIHIGYANKADQLKALYGLNRKSKKWWHRIVFHFFDVALVNTYIIFKQLNNNGKLNLKDFKRNLIHGLIGAGAFPHEKAKRSSTEVDQTFCEVKKHKKKIDIAVRLDSSEHMPSLGGSYRRCNHCSTRLEPHRTKWRCTICQVPLCNNKNECFKKYHRK